MVYDAVLPDRLRDVLAGDQLTEQKMFGGLAFLADGIMAVAASGQGGFLPRCDPMETERWVTEDHVDDFEMHGRQMYGCCAWTARQWRTTRPSRVGPRGPGLKPAHCHRKADLPTSPAA